MWICKVCGSIGCCRDFVDIRTHFISYIWGIYLYLVSLANFLYSSEQATDIPGSPWTCGLRLAPFTSFWHFVSLLLTTAEPCRRHHCSLGNTSMQTGHTDASPWHCMELCGTGSVPLCALASHLQMGSRRLSSGKVGRWELTALAEGKLPFVLVFDRQHGELYERAWQRLWNVLTGHTGMGFMLLLWHAGYLPGQPQGAGVGTGEKHNSDRKLL